MVWEKAEILPLLAAAKIPGISLCQVINGKPLPAIALGEADCSLHIPVTQNTVFEAASLTKPIFAMLVLKLVKEGVIDLDQPFGQMSDIQNIAEYQALKLFPEREQLTARMILMHRTSLPNSDAAHLQFYAAPGEQFKYSGYAYVLLQKIIEQRCGKSFAELTQQFIFDKIPMPHSYMTRPNNQSVAVHHNVDGLKSLPIGPPTPAHAASGIYTTASDYAQFVVAWLQETDELLQSALTFSKENNLTTDKWAIAKGIALNDLEQLAWGLGWGLLKTEDSTIAFHWGDNGDSKALVAINLESRSGIVYFANAWNGLAIAPQLIAKGLQDLKPALQYLFKKYEFATTDRLNQKCQINLSTFAQYELNNQPGWQEKLTQVLLTTIKNHPENFGELPSENTPDWEEKLKSQLAEKLSQQPNSGLETFLMAILNMPKNTVAEDKPELADRSARNALYK